MKILVLGNEFIKEDSLAVELSKSLEEEFEVVHIRNSFALVEMLQSEEEFVILDVVEGLKEPRLLKVEELRVDGFSSAHDLDAGFFLKLLAEEKDIKIVGIPMQGDLKELGGRVRGMISL